MPLRRVGEQGMGHGSGGLSWNVSFCRVNAPILPHVDLGVLEFVGVSDVEGQGPVTSKTFRGQRLPIERCWPGRVETALPKLARGDVFGAEAVNDFIDDNEDEGASFLL